MDGRTTDARAVLVESGRVRAVDGPDLVAAARGRGLRAYDFGERPLLPGFVDPHAHVEIASRALAEMVDCRVPRCRTVEDVLQTLSDELWRAEETGWLVGQGNLFLDQKLDDKRLPTRAELDRVSTKVPIALRAGGHTTVLNSRAFEVSDVVRYAGREGMMGKAVIELDDAGRPTGVISELDKALPLPQPNREQLLAELKGGIGELFTRYGVTSIGEISESMQGLGCMDELIDAGKVHARLSVFLWVPGTIPFADACRWQKHLSIRSESSRFQVRGIKLFADGGYSARNAATRKPYQRPYAVRPGSKGQINLSKRQLASAVRRSRKAGLQLAVHANGERAQDAVCQAVASVGPPDDSMLRTRIEHAGNFVSTWDTVAAWREADIVPVPQPVFLYNFGDFFPVYLGEHGLRGRFPFRSLLRDGWQLSGSSDVLLGSEETQTNPLFSIWCCVRRETFFREIVDPEERLTVDEALRIHTIDAASVLGVAAERGSLEPGKVADVIVLDRDPRTVEPDELPRVQVDYVFVGGTLVYQRAGALPIEERPG